MIFDNWMRSLYEEVEVYDIEEAIWKKVIDESEEGIIALEEKISCQNMGKRHKKDNVKIVISKNPRGGYSVVSANSYYCQISN